jgi:hypothetical protein
MKIFKKGLGQITLHPPTSFSEGQTKALAGEIQDMPFASLVAVLAGTSFKPEDGEEWLRQAAEESSKDLGDKDIQEDASTIKKLLVQVFQARMKPSGAFRDKNFRQVVLEAAIERLAKQAGISANSKQIRESIEILKTGKFFGDASSILAAVFYAIPGFPTDILADLRDKELAGLPVGVLGGVLRDVTGFPSEMKEALKSIFTGGNADDKAQVLSYTLGAFKRLAITKRIFTLLRSMLSKDNRSARLALILYARANGVKISEDNIDSVYTALDPDDPTVGLRLGQALEFLAQEYGADAAMKILRRLRPRK